MVAQQNIENLIKLRRQLHQHPELSGKEEHTSQIILSFLKDYHPDKVVKSLGKNGFAVIYDSGKNGPVITFRCELDALPIHETNDFSHRSIYENISHKCGHDGHMAIVTGLATIFSEKRPSHGKVILLYQPAEETGQGALRILNDPLYQNLKPDYIFALHNIPKLPQNRILIKEGAFTAASKGMEIRLIGATSHAAEPEKGKSPALAMAAIIESLDEIQKIKDRYSSMVMITVIHALLGEIAFGTSPGYAEIRATLRSFSNEDMEVLTEKAERAVAEISSNYGLKYEFSYIEEFPATINDPEAVQYIEAAAKKCNLIIDHIKTPMRWSEDFAYFASRCKAAYFGIGAGEAVPDLHSSDYDFPDELIEPAINLLFTTASEILDPGHKEHL